MNQIENKPENQMPGWLQALLLIGGTMLLAYLLAKLFESLFGEDDDDRSERYGASMPRVFISHSWDYDDDYRSLIKRFDSYNFDFYNHSIPEEKALDENATKDITEGIKSKMRGCSKVLVLAGDYANNYWIKREVEIAKELGKEVIAIRPWGANTIPPYLRSNADRILGFNTKNIIEKIKN